MRMLLRVTVPVEAGNRTIKDGTMNKVLEPMLAKLKPEASYFYTMNGQRGVFIVFDMKDASQIPAIAEPFFMNFTAEVEFAPVMNCG